ncbi:helix-turn-helix domain-containing protein [Saccharothrix longispora]|uniref:DUF5753 domain-containing protein n=1 Tax=Saccharothrix longispora TaxID=33920 RepID=A0ABU1PX20_9PSEU|nr:helix-turn-helix transcriptional regulator [Saccharothrix longispora]MDR6595203.1 hypothetical protein [Saccharothrix longispora]
MEPEEKQPVRLSTARSRELGEELRRVRHAARLSSSVVAENLEWSLGKLSKLETGSRGTSPWEIGTLLGHYGADKPTRARLLAITTEPDTGSFLRLHDGTPDLLPALALHERAARTITTYEPLTVPDLAQTEDYARALLGDGALARQRLVRQEVLCQDTGPEVVLYVNEAALRVVVGGALVMRDQALHLARMSDRPLTLPRVVPMAAGGHLALRSSATLLTFAEPIKPMVWVDTEAATVFHDATPVVRDYEAKMRHLDRVALSVERSHEVLVHWADAYGRRRR